MKKNKTKCKNESVLTKNLKLLKKRSTGLYQVVYEASLSHKAEEEIDDELQVKERIKNSKILFYGNENPMELVRNYVNGWHFEPFDTIFLIGMGLGYLPIEAFKQEIGCPRMIVIEPSIHVFLDALACIDLNELLTNPRIELFVGDEIRVAGIIKQFRQKIPLGKNLIVIHPQYNVVFKKVVETLRKELEEQISEILTQWFTIREHGKLMFKNSMAALPSLFAGIPMRRLRDKFSGVPVICVSAGPSLDEAINELKQINHHALIIACDSAVSALVNSGITPHVVVTVDRSKANINKLKPYVEDLRETVFIFGLESNPDNVRLFLSPRRVAVSSFSKLMSFWLDPQLDLQNRIPQMSSVTHLALSSALAMGADPIVMVGMDLGHVDGKSHAFGSVYFKALGEKKTCFIYGNNGCELSSSSQFISDKMIIERMTHRHTTRFINTSIKGAYIPGTTIRSMAEVIDTEAAEAVNVNRMLDRLDWTCAANESRAVSELKVLCQLLKRALHRCRQHHSELSDTIRTTQSCANKTLDADFYRKAEKEFKKFEKNNLVYMNMTMELMLDDIEEILKRREVFNARQLMKDEDTATDQVDLLVKQYDVFERGFEFQIQEIESLIRYLEEVSALKDRGCGQSADRSTGFELAKCYHRRGELWQAYREYLNCIHLEPFNLLPYVELIQILMDSKLWRPAQRLLLEAESIFSDLQEIGRLKQSVADGIDAIFAETEKQWEQEKPISTRKLLAEYMTLRPNDSKAIELKKKISKLDRQGIAHWKDKRNETEMSSASTMPERLKQAVAFVKEKQLEKGIGILEGMYLDNPENRASIREQIGDIRMMQKDYRSAIWNYQQAITINPLNLALNNKIDRVKSIQEAG